MSQIALVTGASGAIGGAAAGLLSHMGYMVILSGRNPERLATTALRCNRCDPVLGDIADPEYRRLLARRVDGAGGLDLLVHAAAIHTGSMAEVMATNVEAPLELTRRLYDHVVSGQGDIVFINSSQGYMTASPHTLEYSASKHALRAAADSLRGRLNPVGVRVLSIFPGRTASPMQEEIHRREGRPYDPSALIQPMDIAKTILAAVSLPRTAEITDIHIRPRQPPA